MSKGTIRVFGYISDWTARDFIYALEQAVKESPDNVLILLNSEGGSVVAAWEMFQALLDCPANTTVRIQGFAASSASWFALAANRIEATDFSLIMCHNSHIEGEADEKVQKALDAFNNSIATIYANRTGKDKEDILNMMAAESWFTAEEALAEKMIDAVIKTEKRLPDNLLKVLKNAGIAPAERKKAVYAYNQLLIDTGGPATPNKSKMDKEILNLLGVGEDKAPERLKQIIAENGTLKADNSAKVAENTALKAENSNLKADLVKYQAEEKARTEAAAQLAIDNAVKERRITREDAPAWKELYLENAERTEKMLKGITPRQKASDVPNNEGGEDKPTVSAWEKVRNEVLQKASK